MSKVIFLHYEQNKPIHIGTHYTLNPEVENVMCKDNLMQTLKKICKSFEDGYLILSAVEGSFQDCNSETCSVVEKRNQDGTLSMYITLLM